MEKLPPVPLLKTNPVPGQWHVLSLRRAFTLIEILISVALIAILAAVLFSSFSLIRQKHDAIRCTSNLKAIGGAISMFVNDHDGYLPGPSAAYLDSRYTERIVQRPTTATHYLIPYLVADYSNTDIRYVPQYICPAALRVMSDSQLASTRICYQQSPTVYPDGTRSPFPFGSSGDGLSPLKLINIERPAMTIAMFDRGSTSATYQREPIPVHGGRRNFLFFDGHVDVIDASRWGPANGQIRY